MNRVFRLAEFEPDPERDVKEEIETHLVMEIESLMEAGMSEEDARNEAERRFGNRQAIEIEAARHAHSHERARKRMNQVSVLAQDLRFGLRTLRRRPFFSTVAILTLGLGIGSATAIFSLISGILLRQLPYQDPEELVSVWLTNPAWRGHEILDAYWNSIAISFEEYQLWRERSTLFEDVAIHGEEQRTVTGRDDAERVSVGLASESLFQVLGTRFSLGRPFMPGEDGPTAEQVAILSQEYWQSRFGADEDVLDRTITLDGDPYLIVGVLPPGFRFHSLEIGGENGSGNRAVWIPIGQSGMRLDRGNRSFEAIGRLADDASIDDALAETEIILRGDVDPAELGVRFVPRKEAEIGHLRPRLTLLSLGAGLLLLIACGNLAILLLGEAVRRQGELATRNALGASHGRVTRQLLTESMLLGLLGSVIGLALALLFTDGLATLAPPIPRLDQVSVDGWVLLFSAAMGIATSFLFGLIPALFASRNVDRLGLAGRIHGRGGRGRVIRHGLVAFEIAGTGILLVAAILLTRSLSTLLRIDPGFESEEVVTLRVSLADNRYPTDEEAILFYRQLQEAIQANRNVISAGGVEELPLAGQLRVHTFQLEGRETAPDEEPPSARRAVVLPGYHETMRIPVVAGRTFTATDDLDAEQVIVVSESFARQHWPDGSPIGSTLVYDQPRTIVGIVGDVRQNSLDVEIEPTFYVPHAQLPSTEMNMVVRTTGDPDQMMAAFRQAVRMTDPAVPVTRAGAMSEFVQLATIDQRYQLLLMLTFAVASLALAAVGVFGVSARAAAQRAHEMGIRRALGAPRGNLVRLTVSETLRSSVLGLALGLVLALWVTRGMSGFLFGIETTDPATYGVVALVLVCVSVGGSYLPARRCSRVDPVKVLKAE